MMAAPPSFLPFWPRKILGVRPETHQLALTAAASIQGNQKGSWMLEVGTGCGFMATYAAHSLEQVRCLACDCATNSIRAAKLNASCQSGVDKSGRLKFKVSYWLNQLPALRFNVIVSNPPYVSNQSFVQSIIRRRYIVTEGRGSLVNDKNSYLNIIGTCPGFLAGGGSLILEHGFNQGTTIRTLLHKHHFSKILSSRDRSRVQRVSVGFHRPNDLLKPEGS